MWRFWNKIVQPVLTAAEAKTVVEVGSARGFNTTRLIEWAAARGAVVHAIDPSPRFDSESLEAQYPDVFVMHRELSLEALPRIENPDAVLIDGDHNWFTVTLELRCLRRAERWPIVFLHDLDWPYARRDMYYDPGRIPPKYRQPYERSGMVPGQSELSPDGANAMLANAAHEGGPRNGVLTAIEDFMDGKDLELLTVPGDEGLGILLDREGLGSVGPEVERMASAASFA